MVKSLACALLGVALVAAACDGDGDTSGDDDAAVIYDGPPGGGDGAPDGGGGGADGPRADATPPTGNCDVGHIAYTIDNGTVWTVAARTGAVPENLSAALPGPGGGQDDALNLSPNGAWYVFRTRRFGCSLSGQTCLAVFRSDLGGGELVRPGGMAVEPDPSFSAVSGDGNLVVYPSSGMGGHQRDLYATRRSGGTWSTPTRLSAMSSHQYNVMPALSADGTKVLFECGSDPYGGSGTNLCEVATTGGPVTTVAAAGAAGGSYAHHGDYTPTGGVVFESDGTNGEQIYVKSGASIALLDNTYRDDNSPCVLPDGRVVSLWIEGTDHQLKIEAQDRTCVIRNLSGAGMDVHDIGIGCGM